MRMMPNVCVLGHSFVRDVKSYYNNQIVNDPQPAIRDAVIPVATSYAKCMNLEKMYEGISLEVAYRATGKQLDETVKIVGDQAPDICVIQLGTNDLVVPTVNPHKAARKVLDIGHKLKSVYGVALVVFMSCIVRVSGHQFSEWAWWQRMSEFLKEIFEN